LGVNPRRTKTLKLGTSTGTGTCSHFRFRADTGWLGEQRFAKGRVPAKVTKMVWVVVLCIILDILFAPVLHAPDLYSIAYSVVWQ
jgi:hypothetical protein